MPVKNEDDRSSLAQATALGSSIVGAATTLVIPPLAGYWVDRQLGWPGVCVTIGAALGVYLAVQQLRHIANSAFGTAKTRTERESDHAGLDSGAVNEKGQKTSLGRSSVGDGGDPSDGIV